MIPSAPRSTLTPDQAAARSWPAVIIGAGPAGAVAALAAAQRGLHVLLIDKARFPRPKVCGGCLNQAAISVLHSVHAADLLAACGAVPLHRMTLASGRHHAHFDLPPGMAISRTSFDAALIQRAIDSGVHFLDQTAIHIRNGIATFGQHSLTTGVILVCDGLKGTALDADHAPVIRPDARLGVGAFVEAPSEIYPPGIIHMACAADGYVGLVRVENSLLNIAAAIDPQAIPRHGSIHAMLQNIIQQAGFPALPWPDEPDTYHGIGALTRRRQQWWAPQTFIVGDAASYIEPFTGEGMAWAMAGGLSVVPFLQTAIRDGWHDALGQQWQSHWQRQLAPRQRLCRLIAWALRRALLTQLATRSLHHWPGGSRWVTAILNRPWQLERELP